VARRTLGERRRRKIRDVLRGRVMNGIVGKMSRVESSGFMEEY